VRIGTRAAADPEEIVGVFWIFTGKRVNVPERRAGDATS
jgi:hypothetical protein